MKSIFQFFLLIIVTSGFSQHNQLYNVKDLPQGLLHNPGMHLDFDKHFGVPLLSGVKFNMGLTGITAYDIFKIEENTTINDRINKAIFSLSNKNFVSLNQQIEILSMGWRKENKDYISLGWYQESDMIFYFPKDIAVLAFNGNADYIGNYFDASGLVSKGEVLSVFHLGLNRTFSKRLTVGARAKIYSSMFNYTSVNNSGGFITTLTPNDSNFYLHQLQNLDIELKTSGTDGFKNFTPATLAKNSVLSGNMGLGLDVGFSYKISDRLAATGSIIDLGFVSHNEQIRNYYIKGNFNFRGLGFIFPSVIEDGSINPYFENLEDDFNESINSGEETGSSYTTTRPLKTFGSLDYSFGESHCDCIDPLDDRYKHLMGLQFYGIKRPLGPQLSLSAYVNLSLTKFLRTKFTYTVDSFSYSNLGFLMSARIRSFNLYVTADNLLSYGNLAKANSASFQMGIQLISKNKK